MPGLHVLGEANFSDHGANRLGASALMQGLADGYFVIPYTIGDYLASNPLPKVTTDHDAFKEAAENVQKRIDTLLSVKGTQSVRSIHRALGAILWDDVGMSRNEAGLRRALERIPKLRDEFWHNVSVPRHARQPEPEPRVRRPRRRLPGVRRAAGARRAASARVVRRPLPRRKPDARRRSACATMRTSRTWRRGSSRASARQPELHKEPLVFDEVHPTQRSYK